jgi:hypothetical protein
MEIAEAIADPQSGLCLPPTPYPNDWRSPP